MWRVARAFLECLRRRHQSPRAFHGSGIAYPARGRVYRNTYKRPCPRGGSRVPGFPSATRTSRDRGRERSDPVRRRPGENHVVTTIINDDDDDDGNKRTHSTRRRKLRCTDSWRQRRDVDADEHSRYAVSIQDYIGLIKFLGKNDVKAYLEMKFKRIRHI